MSEGIFLPFAPLPVTMHHPLNPDDGELLQEQLRAAGYYPFPIEGIRGPHEMRCGSSRLPTASPLTTFGMSRRKGL